MTNIINIYDWFKHRTNYNIIDWDIITNTIYFNNANQRDLFNIISICINDLEVNIKSMVFNKNEIILTLNI